MKRYGQVVRLKPERRDEYLRHHRAVWPGVLKTIAECNIRNYSIYEHGELLFAYLEYHGNDFAADMAKMAACPETKRWWALMFPMLEKLPPEIEGQRWTDLAEIFHFDGVYQDMKKFGEAWTIAIVLTMASTFVEGQAVHQPLPVAQAQRSRSAAQEPLAPGSAQYQQVQKRLAAGWNTWDVHSVTTQVLLPDGLAIHAGLKHNSTLYSDAFLGDALIGRQTPGAEQVFPGPHSWEGSYTDLRLSWKGHELRLQTAHDGGNLVMLATPLPSPSLSAVPATIVFSVNYLWDRPGTVASQSGHIEAHGPLHAITVYCTCKNATAAEDVNLPVGGAYLSTDFVEPVGMSTGAPLGVEKIKAIIDRASEAYHQSVARSGKAAPVVDAIETVLGWDTIYEPEGRRVLSPVSRVWSVNWGGYVIFDWDTFFAATMASIGDRDLAYADAIETLRSETQQGFVPNYARSGDWKSSDRSEPPVGSITVLGIYQRFHDRWFLKEAFAPLLRWNRWWARNVRGPPAATRTAPTATSTCGRTATRLTPTRGSSSWTPRRRTGPTTRCAASTPGTGPSPTSPT